MTVLYFWIVLLVLLLLAEAISVQLVSIWFALGALVALIVCGFDGNVTAQLVSFAIVSVAALILTRPFVKRFTSKKKQPTNADRNIGAEATVLEEINNTEGRGLVTVKGVHWTARSVDGQSISKDETVIVESIEGVKLIVRRQIQKNA